MIPLPTPALKRMLRFTNIHREPQPTGLASTYALYVVIRDKNDALVPTQFHV